MQQPNAVDKAETIVNMCALDTDSMKVLDATTLVFKINTSVEAMWEVHCGVSEFVRNGSVIFTPNVPKPKPVPCAVEGTGEEVNVVVPLAEMAKLTPMERKYNAQYPKQIPLAIVISHFNATTFVSHEEYSYFELEPRPKLIRQLLRVEGEARNDLFIVEKLFGADVAETPSSSPTSTRARSSNAAEGEEGDEPASGIVATEEDEDDDSNLCVICLTNEKTGAIMPCRHMCLCKECGEELLKRIPTKCPVCRGPAMQVVTLK